MASLIEDLIDTLEQENDIYKGLLPMAEQKTLIIVKNDLEELENITAKEQEAVNRVLALEKKRSEIVINIGTVLNRNPGSLSLKNLVELLDKQPEEQKKLSALHKDLKQNVQRLADINSKNKNLIEQSLEMIEFNLNFIQSTRTLPGNGYTKGAQAFDAPSLQTGIFDAKQ